MNPILQFVFSILLIKETVKDKVYQKEIQQKLLVHYIHPLDEDTDLVEPPFV